MCSIKEEFEALLQLTLLKSFSKVAFNNPVYNYINEPCSNFFPLINGTNLSKFLLQGIQTEVSQSVELPFAEEATQIDCVPLTSNKINHYKTFLTEQETEGPILSKTVLSHEIGG